MSTSTQQSNIDFSRADHLQKDEVVSRKGLVDATLVRNIDEPKHLNEWYRLSVNEGVDIPAGGALVFKVDGGWKKAHFFDGGRIVGPLVCAVDEIGSPRSLYRSQYKSEMSPFELIIMTTVTLVLLSLFGETSNDDPTGHIGVFATAVCALSVLGFARIFLSYRIPYWRGDDACLKKLQKAKTPPVWI